MSEYLVTPEDEPSWTFHPDDFAAQVMTRWPNANVQVNGPDEDVSMHGLIPYPLPRRSLGLALLKGVAISLDPADPRTAAEFVLWYVTQLPSFDPPVSLYSHDYADSMELRADTTEDEIRDLPDPERVDVD